MKLNDVVEFGIGKVSPQYKMHRHMEEALHETFLRQQYAWLVKNLKPNTIAVDIGAFIGDSAIYLAMRDEVAKVEAFEPFPDAYHRAVKNVSDFGSKKIKVHLGGVSGKVGKFKVSTAPQGMTSSFKDSRFGVEVESYTLDNILKNKKNVIIKCDCEGEEHNIFNKNLDLSNVYRIQMEYHHGYSDLKAVLEKKGFKVIVQEVARNTITLGDIGWLYCYKGKA